MSSNPAHEKLDPRVKRTRALIQNAFLDLLAEKDFQSITVQDITHKAEINRATFYAHYLDKFALLETSIDHIFRQELEKRTLNACRYSPQNLQALVVTVCEFISLSHTRNKVADPQYETLVERQVRNQIQELLELWLKQTGRPGDLKTAATAASWSIYGLALQWNHDKRDFSSVEDYVDHILPLVASILQFTPVGAPA
ncbi:MAG: TetR family transcriptional regulator [Anaerolineaceae bacterium]|jgi:AcrR family transcriptional regulator|nr:TetR family transcriptional regulator [Anaerolineaceae bacterium]